MLESDLPPGPQDANGGKWRFTVYVGIPDPKIYEYLILVENLPAIFGAWGVDPTPREFDRALWFFAKF